MQPSARHWRHPLCLASQKLRPWLADTSSLTARLKSRFTGVHVQVLDQGWRLAHHDELHTVHLHRSHTQVACREVLLCSGTTPLVFAHSITPRTALRGGFHLLGRIGSRPLGELLFANPTITRSPITWRRVDSRHPLWRKANAAAGPLPKRVWARRSVFYSAQDQLLVTELFLPVIETTP